MSVRLENTIDGFQKIVTSREWAEVESSCERFQSRQRVKIELILFLMKQLNVHMFYKGILKIDRIRQKLYQINCNQILKNNTSQINSMVVESEAIQENYLNYLIQLLKVCGS